MGELSTEKFEIKKQNNWHERNFNDLNYMCTKLNSHKKVLENVYSLQDNINNCQKAINESYQYLNSIFTRIWNLPEIIAFAIFMLAYYFANRKITEYYGPPIDDQFFLLGYDAAPKQTDPKYLICVPAMILGVVTAINIVRRIFAIILYYRTKNVEIVNREKSLNLANQEFDKYVNDLTFVNSTVEAYKFVNKKYLFDLNAISYFEEMISTGQADNMKEAMRLYNIYLQNESIKEAIQAQTKKIESLEESIYAVGIVLAKQINDLSKEIL